MGQAPATGRNSLRTTPRNFPGRSGTTDDAVWLCSPETADEILPAGAEALPYRSNIPRISDFAFTRLSASYPEDARELRDDGGHVVAGGTNYGQGSSREHAAVAPRHPGLRVVLACSFARIHRQNLINYGVLPLTFEDAAGYHELREGDVLEAAEMPGKLASDEPFRLHVRDRELSVAVRHGLSDRERELIRCGGLVNRMRQEMRKESS